jgi:hypothetical protein
MQTKSTFTEANWDFINERGNGTSETWQMPDGCGYPLLSFFHSEIPFPLIGSGNVSDPYLISDANDLGIVSWYPPGCYFKLMGDIDLSGIHWSVPVVPVFNGYFDGNNRRVLNMQISSRRYLGLFGFLRDQGQIRNLGLEGGSVNGGTYVGGLVGLNDELASISDCYTSVDVNGGTDVGGLVGENWGSVSNCYSTANVEGDKYIGGLVGTNEGVDTILNCYSTGEVSGGSVVGGLVGYNYHGSVSNCYSTGDLNGMGDNLGGLVGWNEVGRISNCYSTSDVSSSGGDCTGGLVGKNRFGIVFDCYSTGYVSGWEYDGGLVGLNYQGSISRSFWDIQTSGMSYSAGGTGLPTYQMKKVSTFTDAGWDFSTPVWIIDEGYDYPRLLWELTLVLHPEPEITLGTSNTISWEPVYIAVEYYAECADDPNFTSIISNTGWITETSYKFTGLELGKRYWYNVKARNAAGIESQWSNLESSLQCNLSDAVDIMLDANNFKSKNLKSSLINKINVVLEMIDEGLYENAISKLENDILQKTNGCAEMGEPDKNDWIITCEAQSEIYPLVIETIEYVKDLMEQIVN